MGKDTITGTRGSPVQMEIRGIGEVINYIRAKGKDIEQGVEVELVRQGAFIEEELKNSIAGRRKEPKSVNTGLFLNSIRTDLVDTKTVKIGPLNISYPGTGTPVAQIASWLEFGTTRITERRHFRNTADRNKKKVYGEINKAINRAIRGLKALR